MKTVNYLHSYSTAHSKRPASVNLAKGHKIVQDIYA